MTDIETGVVFGTLNGAVAGTSTGRDGAASGALSNVGILVVMRKGVDSGAVDRSMVGLPLAAGEMSVDGKRGRLG